jgi:hypothetical protein
VLLGLLLAPSAAGMLLGLGAVVAFVARTPVKVVLVDRFRGRWLPRTALAARVASAELAVLALLVVLAVALAGVAVLVPLLVALPLIGLELWFDMRSRSRRLLPEMAGTIGIGSVGASIVLAGGGDVSLAIAAWAVVAARATASLPFVRYQLHRTGARSLPRIGSDGAQVGVGLAAVAAGAAGWWPWPVVGALVALAGMQLALARLAVPRAAFVGVQQLVLGLALVVVAGVTLP